MKKIFILTLILGMVFLAGKAFAQESAEKYGVKFPVSELGGCDSISSCRSFCGDPVNKSACVAFAKQKGFYKEQGNDRQQELLGNAKSELGCASADACREFCHIEGNFDKCSAFAKKYNTGGGQIEDPHREEVLQKARDALGCDSPDSCRNFCHQEANRQKCSEFAKQSGLRGGEKRVGPGGCTSEETCKSFCSDPANFNACSTFGKQGGPNGQGGPGGQFRGPGGCTSEESCRSHCEQNPQSCKIIPTRFDGPGMIDHPAQAQEQFKQFCQSNPDKCREGGNFSPFSKEGRGKFEEFCKDNPEKCRGEGDKFRGFEPAGSGEGFGGGNPEEFCAKNPDKCKGPQGQDLEGRPTGQFQNPDQFCKDNSEKCRQGPGGPNGFRGEVKLPEGMKDARFNQEGHPSEGFRPQEGFRPGGEGQQPQESFRGPESGKGPEGPIRPPDNGGNPGAGEGGSNPP